MSEDFVDNPNTPNSQTERFSGKPFYTNPFIVIQCQSEKVDRDNQNWSVYTAVNIDCSFHMHLICPKNIILEKDQCYQCNEDTIEFCCYMRYNAYFIKKEPTQLDDDSIRKHYSDRVDKSRENLCSKQDYDRVCAILDRKQYYDRDCAILYRKIDDKPFVCVTLTLYEDYADLKYMTMLVGTPYLYNYKIDQTVLDAKVKRLSETSIDSLIKEVNDLIKKRNTIANKIQKKLKESIINSNEKIYINSVHESNLKKFTYVLYLLATIGIEKEEQNINKKIKNIIVPAKRDIKKWEGKKTSKFHTQNEQFCNFCKFVLRKVCEIFKFPVNFYNDLPSTLDDNKINGKYTKFVIDRLRDIKNLKDYLNRIEASINKRDSKSSEDELIKYRFPGGKRKYESGKNAACRELCEEIPAFELQPEDLVSQHIGSFDFPPNPNKEQWTLTSVCHVVQAPDSLILEDQASTKGPEEGKYFLFPLEKLDENGEWKKEIEKIIDKERMKKKEPECFFTHETRNNT